MARPARPEPKVFLSDSLAMRGREWYRETYFEHATTELLLGEKSTSYIEDPEAAVRAARVLGSTEVLALLRDPVQRAVSNWRFSTDNGFETRPLETALRENLAGSMTWDSTSTSVSPFAYLERGRYTDYLDPWFEVFSSSMHVVFMQDLVDRVEALDELFTNLGVRPGFRPASRDKVVNESREPAPALPASLVGRLREYFAVSDRALRSRLGRELPWPTASV